MSDPPAQSEFFQPLTRATGTTSYTGEYLQKMVSLRLKIFQSPLAYYFSVDVQ